MDRTLVFGLLVMAYFFIVFMQSGLDKYSDWSGNKLWLSKHFAGTPFENRIGLALGLVVIFELFAATLSLVGLLEIILFASTTFAFLASVFAVITFLMLLFGQRVAKDYEGAKTLVIYMIPALLAVYFLN